MEVIRNLNENDIRPNVATIGFFDGVHKGHQFLIRQVLNRAQSTGLAATAITFDRHPRKVMQQDYQPLLLSTTREKCDLLAQTGLDYTVLLPFSMEMSQLTAFEFMQTILYDKLNVRILVIGYDHHFGHNRTENFEDYVRYGREIGMEVVLAKVCKIGDINISSSVIRTLLNEGEVAQAAVCLGRHYSLSGRVIGGHQVGRTLGFPTANIQVDCPDKLRPARGVYAVWVTLDGHRYKGMLNIGVRPTLDNGDEWTLEVHILQFHDVIYHKELMIGFVSRIRDERKFRSTDELVAQLRRDAETVETVI